jgi:hypothetical protein
MAFGFGGKVGKSEHCSHCFEVNGNEKDPAIESLEGLLATYRKSLS